MKKSIVLIAVVLMTCASTLNAQVLKVGHVNLGELLQSMPELKKSDSALQSYQKAFEDQYNSMTEEYQKKLKAYQEGSATWTEPVKEVKANEITDLQKRIQEFQQTYQEKMTGKKQEIIAPILKKAQDAIQAVAKENGYTYILDASQGCALLYSVETSDIMPLVKKKLGLK